MTRLPLAFLENSYQCYQRQIVFQYFSRICFEECSRMAYCFNENITYLFNMKNSSTLSFQAKEHLLKIYYLTDCHSIGSAAKEAGIEHVKAESVVKAIDKEIKFQLEAIGWAMRIKRHSILPTQAFALDQAAAEARFSAILVETVKKDDIEQGYYDPQELSESVSQPKPKMRLTILKGKVQALQLEILRILALIDQEIVDSTSR